MHDRRTFVIGLRLAALIDQGGTRAQDLEGELSRARIFAVVPQPRTRRAW